ncbi:ParB/RepB/Spo0J family partition protein [Candidatus Protochlamydia phocaeensis]|uniref:ParB/RepB/Spo0J family partition protein n=1 Tax=Candidatus Protochlamydia phocaeensis TaxID=1414722 RepID=UPI00083801A8|nr:ParB/RepB/Spo0J family partition protein [Candidatus Protochlamydia phocaeensis]
MDSSLIDPPYKDELREVALTQISVNPYQPRRDFKREDLEELAQSIKAVGLLHPPLVRPLPDSEGYELISGERRYRAAQLAGLSSIPVFIRQTSCSLSAQAALIENIQRVDLNPLEIAKALKRLMLEFDFNQDRLAQRVGKKRSTIANYLRLLSLPVAIQDSILKEKITMGHAKAILALEEEDKQQLLHDLIIRDQLNVREAEQAAARIGEKAKKQQLTYVTRDFYLEQLAEKLQHRLGTKVSIQGKGKKGRISIDYYNLDDLDRLLHLFGLQQEL